jgi:hypothetical protein
VAAGDSRRLRSGRIGITNGCDGRGRGDEAYGADEAYGEPPKESVDERGRTQGANPTAEGVANCKESGSPSCWEACGSADDDGQSADVEIRRLRHVLAKERTSTTLLLNLVY